MSELSHYPHLSSDDAILGGVPIITGTRVPVRAIAAYYQMGQGADEIQAILPFLSKAQVYTALAYYFDHQLEIDRDLADAENIDKWQKEALNMAFYKPLERKFAKT